MKRGCELYACKNFIFLNVALNEVSYSFESDNSFINIILKAYK